MSLLAGAIGQRVAGTEKRGCLGTMAVGVLGAFVGGALYRALRGSDVEVFDELDLGSILVATLGAVEVPRSEYRVRLAAAVALEPALA